MICLWNSLVRHPFLIFSSRRLFTCAECVEACSAREIFSMHARVDWSVSMRYISIHIFNEQHMLTSINMYLCFTLVCVRISVTIRYMRGHYLNVIYASSYRLFLLNNYYNRYTDKHIFYNILNYRLVGRGMKLKKKKYYSFVFHDLIG